MMVDVVKLHILNSTNLFIDVCPSLHLSLVPVSFIDLPSEFVFHQYGSLAKPDNRLSPLLQAARG